MYDRMYLINENGECVSALTTLIKTTDLHMYSKTEKEAWERYRIRLIDKRRNLQWAINQAEELDKKIKQAEQKLWQ